jgi:hypothetical protein
MYTTPGMGEMISSLAPSPTLPVGDASSTFPIWRRLTYPPGGKFPSGLGGVDEIELYGPRLLYLTPHPVVSGLTTIISH